MKTLQKTMIAAYLAGAILTYGFLHIDMRETMRKEPKREGALPPEHRAALNALLAAPVWPLYWSVRLAEQWGGTVLHNAPMTDATKGGGK